MRESLRLGRIAGINVGINWSVLVVFFLITFGLAAGRFPLLYPGSAAVTYVLAGLAAGIVFFLSLLAHELGHAVVAQRTGVRVEGITLWLFGGVARLTGEAPDPAGELRIAGVGPLISLILAGVFALVARVLSAAGVSGLGIGVFAWLALVNLALGVFNLVPAAPLDGGRLLRAFLWRRHGDRQRAAVTAASAGRAFGWILVIVGLLLFVLVEDFGGLWFVLIGWFLINAASAEAQHARMQAALGDTRVREVMSADPTTVPPHLTVEEFLEDFVFPNRFSTFPVTDDGGRLTGLVTLNRAKQVARDRRASTTVEQIACRVEEVATASPDEPLADLLPRLADCADRRAVVIDARRIVGIVSPSDIAHQLHVADLRGMRGQRAEHL